MIDIQTMGGTDSRSIPGKTAFVTERACAAYLLVSGIRLVDATYEGFWHRWEFADDDGRASQALRDWVSGEARVSPRPYASMIRLLSRKQIGPGE